MIDFNKPVQTRDGRKVRVLCKDRAGAYQIVGLIQSGGEEFIQTWLPSGEALKDCESKNDLINVPERVERWLCKDFRKSGASWTEHDVQQVDFDELPWPHQIRITYEDGKPVAVALEDCK